MVAATWWLVFRRQLPAGFRSAAPLSSAYACPVVAPCSGVVTSGNSLDYTAEDMAAMVHHEASVKVWGDRGMGSACRAPADKPVSSST